MTTTTPTPDLAAILRKAQDLAIMVPREGWDIRKESLDNMAIDLAELITPEVIAAATPALAPAEGEVAELVKLLEECAADEGTTPTREAYLKIARALAEADRRRIAYEKLICDLDEKCLAAESHLAAKDGRVMQLEKGYDELRTIANRQVEKIKTLTAALAEAKKMPECVNEMMKAFQSWLQLCERCRGNGCEWCGERGRAYFEPVERHYVALQPASGEPKGVGE